MDLTPYIYDNGFSKRYYICSCCGSKALKQNPMGGFTPPRYLCMDCGSLELSPKWESIVEPEVAELASSEAWIGVADYYHILKFTNEQHN